MSGFQASAPTAARRQPIESRGAMRATETGREASSGKAAICFDKTEIKAVVEALVRGVEIFFVWNRHNPLKSPESDEGIQENPRKIPWSGLVRLGV